MVSTSWSAMLTTYACLGCMGDRLSTCFSARCRMEALQVQEREGGVG